MIYLNDALKKGYMINDTLDLSSRVMSLETAKEIMNKCTNVSGKTLSFSEDTWGLILSDDDAIEILEGIYSKGWNSNEPDIQIIAASGYNGKVNYNGSEQTLTQSETNPNLWLKRDAGSITSLYNFLTNSTQINYVRKVRFGKNINTSSCTTIEDAFRSVNATDTSNLSKIDVRNLDTHSVTMFRGIFDGIDSDSLTIIGYEDWYVSAGTNFVRAFNNTSKYTHDIDLHKWHVSSSAGIANITPALSSIAERALSTKIYYTPGYWERDPMSNSNLAADRLKPVVYPYHDITVAGTSSYAGGARFNGGNKTLTKDNTLNIWYYDIPSDGELYDIEAIIRGQSEILSVSFKKDIKLRDTGVGCFQTMSSCSNLRTFEFPSEMKLSSNFNEFAQYGNSTTNTVLTGLYGPEKIISLSSSVSGGRAMCCMQAGLRYFPFDFSQITCGTYITSAFDGCTNLIRIKGLPGVANGCGTTNAFRNCSALTTIDACGPISETISFADSPLNLASAKVVLAQLQTVTSETISFSTTTWSYILVDDEAIELLDSAYNRGWNSNEPDIQVTADSGYNGVVRVNSADLQLTQVGSTGFWYGTAPSSVTSLDYFMKHNGSSNYNSTSENVKTARFGRGMKTKTASCTSIDYMFSCNVSDSSKFVRIDVTHLNTSSVTIGRQAFAVLRDNSEGVVLRGIEDLDMHSATTLNNMFIHTRVKGGYVDLHKWHVNSSSASFEGMFGSANENWSMGINNCFYVTPGYWGKNPISNYSAASFKPVPYPYHDINVVAASGFNGKMYVDSALVNMTKDNTLGIWYYDFGSSYTFTTNSVRSLFRNSANSTVTDNLYSVSFKKDAFSRANDASLDTYGMFMGCRALRSVDAASLSNKMTTGAYQMWNMGTASSSNLVSMNLPEFTQNYGYSATFQYCDKIRYVKFPTIKNASGYFASLFSGCTSLRRITNMPGIVNGANTSNAFSGCTNLTIIDSCGPISETIDISAAPLNLASAKVILRQLQTVVSETCTFSSTTLGYINNDNEALNLVSIARGRGWNIPGATVIGGTIKGIVTSGTSSISLKINNTVTSIPCSNGSFSYQIDSAVTSLKDFINNQSSILTIDFSELGTATVTDWTNMMAGFAGTSANFSNMIIKEGSTTTGIFGDRNYGVDYIISAADNMEILEAFDMYPLVNLSYHSIEEAQDNAKLILNSLGSPSSAKTLNLKLTENGSASYAYVVVGYYPRGGFNLMDLVWEKRGLGWNILMPELMIYSQAYTANWNSWDGRVMINGSVQTMTHTYSFIDNVGRRYKCWYIDTISNKSNITSMKDFIMSMWGAGFYNELVQNIRNILFPTSISMPNLTLMKYMFGFDDDGPATLRIVDMRGLSTGTQAKNVNNMFNTKTVSEVIYFGDVDISNMGIDDSISFGNNNTIYYKAGKIAQSVINAYPNNTWIEVQ